MAGTALAEPPEAQPASELRPFQPGVSIDWRNRAVYVDAHVALRSGPLEFLACFGGKEHESVLRFEASATHIYMALGLVGLSSGRPPRWDTEKQVYLPPEGDLIDLWIEYAKDGATRRVSGFEWTRAVEYAETPVACPWIFAGSQVTTDGGLAADRTGEGVAVVDMPNSLLALSRHHSSSNTELWLEADAAAIPADVSEVRVILAPAQPRTYRVSFDFRGVIFIDGRYAEPADLAGFILLNLKLDPDYVQKIELDDVMRSDLKNIIKVLRDEGVSESAIEICSVSPSSQPKSAR